MKQLGQREYWPLEQAAKYLGVPPEDLIHACAMGRIHLCINAFRITEEAHVIRMDPPLRLKDFGLANTDEVGIFEDAQWEHWNRAKVRMPEGVYEFAYDDARCMEVAVDNKISMKQALRFDGHDWWIVEFEPSIDATYKQIVVRQEELDKFKNTSNERSKIDSRTNTAYLNIIGILSHILRSRPGKELSEAALIQTILTTEMRLRSDPKEPLYGLSERSLQDKLKLARQSLSIAGVELTQEKSVVAAKSMGLK